jgi:hypothetical protein
MRNLAAKVPEDLWPEFKARVQACYPAPGRAIARDLAAGLVADYARELPSAIACFEDDFEACIAHLRMPVTHRRAIRTTNLLERLFVEERRRLKIIANAFGERPVLKLMFGAMIRAAERWRAIKVTDFERRQMAAVRQELDQEYEAAIATPAPLQPGPPQPIYPAGLGLDLLRILEELDVVLLHHPRRLPEHRYQRLVPLQRGLKLRDHRCGASLGDDDDRRR